MDAPKSDPFGPPGVSWLVHKFGGTCVGTVDRIKNVAGIIAKEVQEGQHEASSVSSPRRKAHHRLIVVSAMSGVTNSLYKVIAQAEAGDEAFVQGLEELQEKHTTVAHSLLPGEGDEECSSAAAEFITTLKEDVSNLKAMLRAIFIVRHATEAFRDFLVGHGELWSSRLLSALLTQMLGVPCPPLDARDVLVVTVTGKQVDPLYPLSREKLHEWYFNRKQSESSFQLPSVVVATGFIARTPEGVPTTLQRDGSDFSAAIFGALLVSDRVTIWTDVDGVFSADPRKVTEAKVLEAMSYQEAWEMSYFGASVLHPRTTVPVMRLGIPIFIRNAFNASAPGTCIHSAIPHSHPHDSFEAPSPRHHSHHSKHHHTEPPADVAQVESPRRAAARQEGSSRRGRRVAARQVPKGVVTGFATIDKVALINVEGTGMAGVPGTASAIFSTVKDVGANVIAISQASSEHSVSFAVPAHEAASVVGALETKFKSAIEKGHISRVDAFQPCSVLAAVGQRMASTPGVSAALFSALAKAGVNVRAIAQGSTEYNITVAVDTNDTEPALNAAHARFFGQPTAIALGLVGPGLIGSTLLSQIEEQASTLERDLGIELRVVGICSSTKMVLNPRGVSLSGWKGEFQTQGIPLDLEVFSQFMAGLPVQVDTQNSDSKLVASAKRDSHLSKGTRHWLPHAAVLDCTASADVASLYRHWLLSGLHVITPNKKAPSGPLPQYKALMAASRGPGATARFFHEGTVGAGLPILSTVQSLRDTGDRITRIQGIFSGTLSYLFNTFDGSVPFSRLVQDARSAGFTEPDPRDDLNGMDVARKVVILAREAGLEIELKQVDLQSLVPEPLQAIPSAEEFLQGLPEFDGDMTKQLEEAAASQKVLRFIGQVDVQSGSASARLTPCDKSHPFAQLSGSDNIVAFYTTRYSQQPLVVRGPGAGAQVTAGGVFADILRLSCYLGATC